MLAVWVRRKMVIAARKDPETGAMVDRHLARSYVIMVGLDHR